jgi:hypothetical protein
MRPYPCPATPPGDLSCNVSYCSVSARKPVFSAHLAGRRASGRSVAVRLGLPHGGGGLRFRSAGSLVSVSRALSDGAVGPSEKERRHYHQWRAGQSGRHRGRGAVGLGFHVREERKHRLEHVGPWELIRKLSHENPLWGAEVIRLTLLKLQYDPPCEDTIRKYMPPGSCYHCRAKSLPSGTTRSRMLVCSDVVRASNSLVRFTWATTQSL